MRGRPGRTVMAHCCTARHAASLVLVLASVTACRNAAFDALAAGSDDDNDDAAGGSPALGADSDDDGGVSDDADGAGGAKGDAANHLGACSPATIREAGARE